MPRCISRHHVSIIVYPGIKKTDFILLHYHLKRKIVQYRFHVCNLSLYLVEEKTYRRVIVQSRS